MGKLSFFANIREWIAGIAFDVFLWGVQMTQEEYFDTITSGLTPHAPDAAEPCQYCKRVHDSSLACPEYAAQTAAQVM